MRFLGNAPAVVVVGIASSVPGSGAFAPPFSVHAFATTPVASYRPERQRSTVSDNDKHCEHDTEVTAGDDSMTTKTARPGRRLSMPSLSAKNLNTIFSGLMTASLLWVNTAGLVVPFLPMDLSSDTMAHYSYFSVQPASAKEMASGTGSRVNKDAESLLRYGLPITNKEVRQKNSFTPCPPPHPWKCIRG